MSNQKQRDPDTDFGFHAKIPRVVRTGYKNLIPLQKWLYTCLKDLCGDHGKCQPRDEPGWDHPTGCCCILVQKVSVMSNSTTSAARYQAALENSSTIVIERGIEG